eukprot:4509912-Alexandrium_andersonii.AAC.1
MQRALSLTGSQVTKCQMGAFVGPTAKDTLLNGRAPFLLRKLARRVNDLGKQDIKANPISLCDNYVDISGETLCCFEAVETVPVLPNRIWSSVRA